MGEKLVLLIATLNAQNNDAFVDDNYYEFLKKRMINLTSKTDLIFESSSPMYFLDSLEELRNKMNRCIEELITNAFVSYGALIGTDGGMKDELLRARKYRNSNLFDCLPVSYPLLTCIKSLNPSKNLQNIDIEEYMALLSDGLDDFKVKYMPYFINPKDYLWAFELKSILNGENCYDLSSLLNDYCKEIGKYYGLKEFNHINKKMLFRGEEEGEMKYQAINLDFSDINSLVGNKKDGHVTIAVAGINMDNQNITKGDDKAVDFSNPSNEIKKHVVEVLNDAYINEFKPNITSIIKLSEDANLNDEGIDDEDEENQKKCVDIILFPEVFLPIQWIHLIDKFCKQTQSIICTGLRYILYKNQVFNLLAVEIPYFDEKNHRSSIIVLRPKNVMPLYEKGLIVNSIKGTPLQPFVPQINFYEVFKIKDLKFAPLICYEATDVVARAIFKNNINYIFCLEYNKDVNYFGNIAMSTSRDLFCYYIECNSSNYGSKSFAPFRDKYLPIACDKGDSRDHMQIVNTDYKLLEKYKELYLKYDAINDNKGLEKETMDKDDENNNNKFKIFKKLSANTK